MEQEFFGYRKKDFLIAVSVSLCLLLFCSIQLTCGMPNWGGDDFAAYISEGIAISTGTFREQVAQNIQMHPSPLPVDAPDDQLIYVWGFPLLLSLVHQLVGFDFANYSTFFFYKIPSLCTFALMAGALFLYYRRYFSAHASFFLTLFFASNYEFVNSVNFLNVDIPFLFFCIATLLVSECFFSSFLETRNKSYRYLLAIGLGILLWWTYETRLNGNTILIIVVFSHIVRLHQMKKPFTFRQYALHLLPYLLFVLLKVISEAILLPATSNLSDVGNLSPETILQNIRYYFELTNTYWNSLMGSTRFPFWMIFGIFTAIGLVRQGITAKHLHLSVLLIGTYLVLILLPYTQGLRYLFSVLPVLMLFCGYGGKCIWNWISPKLKINESVKNSIVIVISLLILCHVYVPWICNGKANLEAGQKLSQEDVYSFEAIDMYRYIQDNIDDSETIAFQKPRALYLNTGKSAFVPYVNSHDLYDADYFLVSAVAFPYTDISIIEKEKDNFSLVYENNAFSLYRINIHNRK